MDWSWVLLLLCPLMMISMMFFMMKGYHSDRHTEQKNLTEELEQLKRQNETMQKELRDLKNPI